MQKYTGLDYLKIDIANQYGWDKIEWLDRIAWVNNTEAAFPSDLDSKIDEASDPLLYIKAVNALRATNRDEATGFIMGLDATASGLQIMAVMSGCKQTAKNVNLTDTGKREDVYGMVADEMNRLPGITVDRKLIKKPVMTTFYGSKAQPKNLFGEDSPELDAFYHVLEKELPGAMGLMEDMQSCWNPDVLEHQWTLPDGHVVVAKVMHAVDKRIEVDELDGATFTHRAYINAPDDHGISLAANIIHSIDGYIVREMVRKAHYQGFQLVTIHDSFWACPNDMNLVRQNYIDIMCDLAKGDLMESILREVSGDPSLCYTKLSENVYLDIEKSNYALS